MFFNPSKTYKDTETVNIVSHPHDEKILDSLTNSLGFFAKDIEARFEHRLLRLNKEKIKIACQIVGCKPFVAKTISDKTVERFQIASEESSPQSAINRQDRHCMYITKTNFFKIFKEELEKLHCNKERSILDFELALSILEKGESMIVLLGGTSGSGKSTIASLLASRFGIPSVLSTDSIRHVMRNFMSNEDCPVLFCSTYEAGTKIKVDEDVKESKRIVMGFQQQAAAVQQRLEGILEDFYSRGESIVVEGVHLTPDFLTAMTKKFNNCTPFLIYISNENKHRERFAVRSKYMTLEKRHNKYVQNFESIRRIQKYLTKKADEHLIPKLDNSNVDKSVGLVHRTLIRCLRRIRLGKSLADLENNNAITIYEQFNAVTKNIWSSNAVKNYICTKGKKPHKSEIFKRFFEQNAKELTQSQYSKMEPELLKNLLEKGKENIDVSNNMETNNSADLKSDSQFLNKIKPQVAFKEDFIALISPTKRDFFPKRQKSLKTDHFEGDKSDEFSPRYDHLAESPEKIERFKISLNACREQEYKKPLGLNLLLQKSDGFMDEPEQIIQEEDEDETRREEKVVGEKLGMLSRSQENLQIMASIKDDSPTLYTKVKSEEVKVDENARDQRISLVTAPKSSLKLNSLEELLSTRHMITIRGISLHNTRAIRRFINTYNIKHQESFLKLSQENQRYIIYKYNKFENDNSPRLPSSKSHHLYSEYSTRGLSRFATKRYDDLTPKKSEELKNKPIFGTDGNLSDDNAEASDEESLPSVASQEKWSNMSETFGHSFQIKNKSSVYNLSDKYDVSDDVESVTKQDEEDTSMEVLQSGNSISEHTIEEDEDDEAIIHQIQLISQNQSTLLEDWKVKEDRKIFS